MFNMEVKSTLMRLRAFPLPDAWPLRVDQAVSESDPPSLPGDGAVDRPAAWPLRAWSNTGLGR
jgi:hypothetical protein